MTTPVAVPSQRTPHGAQTVPPRPAIAPSPADAGAEPRDGGLRVASRLAPRSRPGTFITGPAPNSAHRLPTGGVCLRDRRERRASRSSAARARATPAAGSPPPSGRSSAHARHSAGRARRRAAVTRRTGGRRHRARPRAGQQPRVRVPTPGALPALSAAAAAPLFERAARARGARVYRRLRRSVGPHRTARSRARPGRRRTSAYGPPERAPSRHSRGPVAAPRRSRRVARDRPRGAGVPR